MRSDKHSRTCTHKATHETHQASFHKHMQAHAYLWVHDGVCVCVCMCVGEGLGVFGGGGYEIWGLDLICWAYIRG